MKSLISKAHELVNSDQIKISEFVPLHRELQAENRRLKNLINSAECQQCAKAKHKSDISAIEMYLKSFEKISEKITEYIKSQDLTEKDLNQLRLYADFFNLNPKINKKNKLIELINAV